MYGIAPGRLMEALVRKLKAEWASVTLTPSKVVPRDRNETLLLMCRCQAALGIALQLLFSHLNFNSRELKVTITCRIPNLELILKPLLTYMLANMGYMSINAC